MAIILIILARFAVTEASAAFTGLQLQEFCSDHSASARGLACLLYIQGFVDGINASRDIKNEWCFPDGATTNQGRQIIEKYMRDNPALLHMNAALIAGLALMQAFPCSISK